MYRKIFTIPGTAAFSISGAMTRATMSTIGLSMILCLNNLYNEWTSAGLMSAVYIIAASIVTPIYAKLFDRFGQKKVGLITAPIQFGLLLAFAAAAYMRAPLPVLFVLAVLVGCCMYAVGAVVRTRWSWALRDKPEEYLNTAYSLESAIDELIFIVGPIAAATISTSFPPVSTIIPFILFGGINFVGAMIFYNLKSATPPAVETLHTVNVDKTDELAESNSAMSGSEQLRARNILFYPGMLLLVLAITVFNSTFSAFDVTMTAVMQTMGHYQQVGFMLATIAAGSLIGALVFGSRKHTHNAWMRMILFMVLLALGIAGVAMTVHNLWIAAIFGVFSGLFVAPTYASANLIMRNTAPPNKLTEGLSWISTGSTIGASMGSAVGGIFLDRIGDFATMNLVWLFAALAIPFFFFGYLQVRAFEKKHAVSQQ
ncbi:MFS transporter [Alloscardovia criceti]|uniref:MFS transporter n=1 Tax=Alloscardovia criceti TaxID=356828 RepID=UPI000376151D|nr:MFS transporter [Alloscardovia criceti]